ncbi:MAG TPA: aldose 1-epimerase family protein [Rhizomicrobium sp.]|nr:aldose 1-epimerase family protein [Rhizomicrobium sp.]
MTDDPLIKISSPGLRAEIHPLGAQLCSLKDRAGRDLQWNGDPAVWKGRAPILFPIVGALAGNAYRLDGRRFCLSRHGFARDRMFSLTGATSASACLRLNWDSETFALYPFRFQLDMNFHLEDTTLRMWASVENLEDQKILPLSFGFHPAFRWPLPYGQPRAAHALRFEYDEPAPVRRLDAHGLLAPTEFETPVKEQRLELRDDLFAKDAIIFDRIASRRIRYGAEHGPQLEISFEDMPQLGVWTKPEAGFICIEPWHGFSDPQGYSGEFYDKPGLALLPPGTSKDFAMTISLAA